MRLLLLRHGEAKHNVGDFIAGKASCQGLTAQGVQQAERLGRRLKHDRVRCDVLLSTSVRRAQETATIVATQLNQPVQTDDGLCELLPGDADGLSSVQYQQRYGTFDFQTYPNRPFAPNGESWNQFVDRVQTTLHRLHQTYAGQDVVAVTHAGFIVVSFLWKFAISSSKQRAQIHPGYTSITEWQADGDRWQLVRFNDTSHLRSDIE